MAARIPAVCLPMEPRLSNSYWFPAKRYGWGWGLPRRWQGWLVTLAYAALFGAGFLIFPPTTRLEMLLAYIAALTAVLIAICWLKGEPLK